MNDEEPRFDRFVYYTMPILENNEPGLPITQVKAIDKDADVNAEIEVQVTQHQSSLISSPSSSPTLISPLSHLPLPLSHSLLISSLLPPLPHSPLTSSHSALLSSYSSPVL